MKKMLSMLIILVVLVTSVFTGCGQEEKVEADSTTKGSSSEEATVDVKSETDEKVTVTFQTWNPGEGDSIRKIISEFESEHPNITINYVYMPYTDHMEDMKIDLATGEGADVYGMQTGAQYEAFRDFQEDLTPYADKTWGENWQSQYLDFSMDLLDNDGQYFGLPLGLSYAGFTWADVNYLKKYGLEVPKSLNSLKEVSKVLRENNEYPLAIGAKDDWINVDTWMSIANDISPEKLYAAIDGKTPFTDPALIQSFQIWQSLFVDGIVQDGALGVSHYNDTTDLFRAEGSIPLLMNGSWQVGDYQNPDELINAVFNGEGADHDVFLMDWNDDGKPSPITATVDVVLCMNVNSEYKDAAWTFIDFMLHQGQDTLVNEYLQYSPSRTDLVLNVEGLSEDGSSCLEYIVDQSISNIGGYREIAYVDVKQSISEVLKELAIGAITPEEAGRKVEEASKAQVR